MANNSVKSRPATNGAATAAKEKRQAEAIEGLRKIADSNEEERRKTVLERAHLAVHGDRQENYGDQLANFTNIADRMTITLRDKLVAPITPQEVALLMIDVKVARLTKTGGRHFDSIVDIAGYAECLDVVNQQTI